MNSSACGSNGVWLVTVQTKDKGSEKRAKKRKHVFGSAQERDRFISTILVSGTSEREDPSSNNQILVGYSVRKIILDDDETACNDSDPITVAHPQHRCEKVPQTKSQLATTATSGFLVRKDKESKQEEESNECFQIVDQHSEGFDALVKRFELFRRVIEHEDDLLNQRMSWIILAQSFLMAAFISSSSSGRFLYSTAAVGLLTVLVTLPALVAAGKNIEVQQSIYFRGLESDALCRRLHGHNRDKKWPPNEEGRPLSHILPNTAFRSKYGVPILTTVVLLSLVQVVGWCCLLIALVMEGEF